MKPGTLITHSSGAAGIVIPHREGDDPALVMFEATRAGTGHPFTEGQVAALPPNTLSTGKVVKLRPDPVKCGRGLGEKQCVYLSNSAAGPVCTRYTEGRNAALATLEQKLQRIPTKQYPACMEFAACN